MVFSRQDKNPKNYSGNATFIDKTKFKVVDHKEIIMCSNGEGGFNVEKFNSSADMINRRSALLVALEAGTHRLNVINTHMLWDPTPHDTADKIGSAEVLLEAVKKITSELILSGDFNVNPETQTAGMFEAVGVNLTSKYAIVSTIDDTLHTRIAEISADHPQGVACDQVFVSRGIKVHDFGIIPEHLSDHRGLFLEFDFT
jgi:endonuclease/exonuclease/phosphatase family metal-dependent hydrolase